MSILIMGMDMPQDCLECPICRHDSLDGVKAEQCNLTLHKMDWESAERPEDCPLIKIPDKYMAAMEEEKALLIPMSLYERMKRANWINDEEEVK